MRTHRVVQSDSILFRMYGYYNHDVRILTFFFFIFMRYLVHKLGTHMLLVGNFAYTIYIYILTSRENGRIRF